MCYNTPTEKPIATTRHVIAYLDLMGAKDRIIKDSDSIALNQIYYAYNAANKMKEFGRYKSLHIKIFSDNIVVALKIGTTEDDVQEACNLVVEFLCFFQMNCLLNGGWLLRGCVTMGDLHIDNVLIWG